MTELRARLIAEAGLSEDQAILTIGVLRNFINEKVPMFGGMVDSFLGLGSQASTGTSAGAHADPLAEPENPLSDIFDKLGDFLPGDMGKNLEEFMKRTVNEAGEQAENLKDEADRFADKAKDFFKKD